MEELISTDTLDQEILEDARKKAFSILKAADETLEEQNRDWNTKTQKTLEEIRTGYAERARKSREETLARFPLDKRRLRSETTEAFLVKAMNDFLRSLSRGELLSVLGAELSNCLKASSGEWGTGEGIKPKVFYSGLSLQELRGVLEKVMGEMDAGFRSALRTEDWDLTEDSRVHEFPSIVIDTRYMKIIASVENAVAFIMKDKRAELVAALLGEGALND